MLNQASKLLNIPIPNDFNIYPTSGKFDIKVGKVDHQAGLYSFNSFIDAINLAKKDSEKTILEKTEKFHQAMENK